MNTPTDRFLTGSSTGSFSTQSQHRFPVPSPTGTGTGATGSLTGTEPVEPLDPNPVNRHPKEHPVNSTTQTGAEAIAAERQRQIDVEGYTPEHDARHPVHDFVQTAGAYLGIPGSRPRWDVKRADPDSGYYQRRDLVKAGALIAAAIDRLDAVEGAER